MLQRGSRVRLGWQQPCPRRGKMGRTGAQVDVELGSMVLERSS